MRIIVEQGANVSIDEVVDAALSWLASKQRGAWTVQGACYGMNGKGFYPERGESVAEGKAVCARCPVRATCLAEALLKRERFGIWGGVSERGRQRMRAEFFKALAERSEAA
jgi:WhiB family redox-sensing transcriptional regulator